MNETKGTKQALLDKIKELESKLEASQNREIEQKNKLDAFFQAMTYELYGYTASEKYQGTEIDEEIMRNFNIFFNQYFIIKDEKVVGFNEYGIDCRVHELKSPDRNDYDENGVKLK